MNETPRYIPVAIYTIGCYHYGSTEPFKTVEIKEDSLAGAINKCRDELKPAGAQQIRHISTRPNPDHIALQQRAALM